jgi:hypothetical protein
MRARLILWVFLAVLDGRCTGYFDPKSGASVMTGDC